MTFTRWVALGAGVAFLATVPGEAARAQGATTGAITGLVTDAAGKPLENAQVQVVNRSTGFTTGQQTRANGRYYVQNLEVGPNYAVTVRLIGYTPVTQQPVRVTLTQATRVDIQLAQSATQLTAVTVTADAARSADFSPTRQGVQTTVSDTLIRRIPNLDRNFTSLVRLTPQVTSQTGGFSAAGSNPRLSQFTIDEAGNAALWAAAPAWGCGRLNRQLARGTGSERRFDRAHHRPEGDKGVEREVCQQDEALPFRMRDRNGRRVCLAREEQSQAQHHAPENHQRGDRKQKIGSGGGEETHTCGPDN